MYSQVARPRINAYSLVMCASHSHRPAAALAGFPLTNEVLQGYTTDDFNYPLLHAIGTQFFKNFSKENHARTIFSLGLCDECAYKFWQGLGIPPLYMLQKLEDPSGLIITHTMFTFSMGMVHTEIEYRVSVRNDCKLILSITCAECLMDSNPMPVHYKLAQREKI